MVSDMVDDQRHSRKSVPGLTSVTAATITSPTLISNEDYYALAGIFYSTHFMDNLGAKGGETR